MQAPRAFGYTGVGIGPFHFHGGGSASRAKTKSQRDIQFAATVPDENGQLVPLSNGVDRAAASEEKSDHARLRGASGRTRSSSIP